MSYNDWTKYKLTTSDIIPWGRVEYDILDLVYPATAIHTPLYKNHKIDV